MRVGSVVSFHIPGSSLYWLSDIKELKGFSLYIEQYEFDDTLEFDLNPDPTCWIVETNIFIGEL